MCICPVEFTFNLSKGAPYLSSLTMSHPNFSHSPRDLLCVVLSVYLFCVEFCAFLFLFYPLFRPHFKSSGSHSPRFLAPLAASVHFSSSGPLHNISDVWLTFFLHSLLSLTHRFYQESVVFLEVSVSLEITARSPPLHLLSSR